jgi:hypothetical protein
MTFIDPVSIAGKRMTVLHGICSTPRPFFAGGSFRVILLLQFSIQGVASQLASEGSKPCSHQGTGSHADRTCNRSHSCSRCRSCHPSHRGAYRSAQAFFPHHMTSAVVFCVWMLGRGFSGSGLAIMFGHAALSARFVPYKESAAVYRATDLPARERIV